MEVFTIVGEIEDAEDISEKIMQALKDRGRYRSDLMYRGASVSVEQLAKVLKYGTDRNPEDVDAKHEADMQAIMCDVADMCDEEYEEHLERQKQIKEYKEAHSDDDELIGFESYDPEFIWALPEAGLVSCIETYAQPTHEGPIPIVIAFKPDFLLRNTPGIDGHGVPVRAVEESDLLEESLARYSFRFGTTPKDALYAIFRIEDP